MNSRHLKHTLAVAASLSLFGIAGNAAAADPLTWAKGAVPANAVVAGGSKEKPMHICRLPMADKNLHTGKAENGNCYVSYGGKEIKSPLKDAEVLGSSEPTGWADVKAGKLPTGALQSGVIGGVPMHFCRAMHEGKTLHAGKEYKGTCYYGYGGKEIKTADFQVMGLTKAAAGQAGTAVAASKAKNTHARWTAMLNAADTLAHEGSEVKRVSEQEMKNIKASVAAKKAEIAKLGADGFTEKEEDLIDNHIAGLLMRVANSMTNNKKERVHKFNSAAASKKANNHVRWATLLDVAGVLAHEGGEVKRITAAEKKAISDQVAKLTAEIKAKRSNGFSEREEEAIDNHIATMMVNIASYMSDTKRK